MNSVSATVRTDIEVKKKWQDMQSIAKKRESSRRRQMRETGGGVGPAPLSSLDEKVRFAVFV